MALIKSNGNGGGNFSDTASWDGGVVPALGDSVEVIDGDTILVDGDYHIGDDTSTALVINGILKASRDVDTVLTVRGKFSIENGELDYGKTGDIIPANITATINLNDSANLSTCKWGLTCGNNGSYFVHGANKTYVTTLTNDIAAGDTTFTVDDTTGWIVGDIVVPLTDGIQWRGYEDEQIIKSIDDNNVITIENTDGFDYATNAGVYVLNLSRNVIIQAFDKDHQSYQIIDANGDTPDNTREIQNVMTKYLGGHSDGYRSSAFLLRGTFYGKKETGREYVAVSGVSIYKPASDGIKVNFYRSNLIINNTVIYHAFKGVYLSSYSVVTFNNLLVTGCYISLNCYGAPSAIGCKFNDSLILNSSETLQFTNAFEVEFNSCKFYNCPKLIEARYGSVIANNCEFGKVTDTYKWDVKVIVQGGGYNLSDVTIKNSTITTDKVSIAHTASNSYVCGIQDKNKDTTQQELYFNRGSIIRDTDIMATSVASIKFIPTVEDNILAFDTTSSVLAGDTLTVTVQSRKDGDYNGSFLPRIHIVGKEFDVTQEMSDTNDTFETVTLTTPTLNNNDTLKISLETVGTAGNAWFDDLQINGKVYDIGTDLFTGGTEVSNVVDIMNNLVEVKISVGDYAKQDNNAWYAVYYANTYNTVNAVLVKDNKGNDIAGMVDGKDIDFVYDRKHNTQAGLPADTDKDVVVQVQGNGIAKYAETYFTIKKQAVNTVACIPDLETN